MTTILQLLVIVLSVAAILWFLVLPWVLVVLSLGTR